MPTAINFVPAMTSATAPSGVVTASSVGDPSFPEWKAFNQSVGFWDVYGLPWIQYEFASSKICIAYSITADWAASRTPSAWTLYGSETGAFGGEEVSLDSQTGITFIADERKEFSFTNTASYLFYRIDITAANSSQIQTNEIEFIGIPIPKASLTATTTLSSRSKVINRASMTATAIMDASPQIRPRYYDFLFVGEIELARINKTFHFIGKIEQPKTATIIKRVNS